MRFLLGSIHVTNTWFPMPGKTLILIPTVAELNVLDPYLKSFEDVETKLCGFGLVEATINTYREAQLAKPESIVLCGVAGTYNETICQVGQTYCFESVSQYGIGCQRDSFELPSALGFDRVTESLTLQTFGNISSSGRLVSVTSSGTFTPEQIVEAYPDAVVEDMEGYGFALGAIANGIPRISVVRSISNVVGEPFHAWSLDEALDQLGKTLQSHFESVLLENRSPGP